MNEEDLKTGAGEQLSAQDAESAIGSSTDGVDTSEESDLIPKAEVENLLKALTAEREQRKEAERRIKNQESHLQKLQAIDPEKYRALQEEVSEEAARRSQAEERVELIRREAERETERARQEAQAARDEILKLRKYNQLEKIWSAAGGRADSDGSLSFFDMFAEREAQNFKFNKDGKLIVVDSKGNPLVDEETKRPVDPVDFVSAFKNHRVYGTFFKGQKSSGYGMDVGSGDGFTGDGWRELNPDALAVAAFGGQG